MKHPSIACCSLFMLLVACSGQQKKSDAEPVVAADSTVVEAEPTLEELTLPDTTYASVSAMSYVVEHEASWPCPLQYYDDLYDRTDRVMTFRRNLLRDASFEGHVEGTPKEIEVAWSYDTPYGHADTKFGQWGGGTGWTGQPLYVHWSDAEIDSLRKGGAPLTADFGPEEIMVGSLCGEAFFLNFETGRPSRTPLDLHNVVKGTMSIDPELMNLYVGQGVPKGEPLGCQAFSLTTHQRGTFFSDPRAWRGWQAFDSSPIVAGGYLFWTGENGSLFKFERQAGGVLKRVSTMRYRVNGAAPGIESSLCVYRNYGFFSDNHGNIVGVNLNTMHPVWYVKNLDDSDGTIVCRVEDGTPYLYTACEVDKQGSHGQCRFLKLNALTGEIVWESLIDCNRIDLGEKILDGGMYATPLLGQGDCEGILFANVCRNSAHPDRGQFTALSTADGHVLYTVGYGNFCWSSPVGFTNENDEFFVFAADANGVVYVIRGKNGEVLCKKEMGANFESSPCVVGNSLVVGCRGTKIYKFRIKS
ncbi:MAG: dehydrogenase [Prevotella sp.]|nr:dehydrogenase [Prevotella sp.]